MDSGRRCGAPPRWVIGVVIFAQCRAQVPMGVLGQTAGVRNDRRDPFTAPPWVWPLALSAMALNLGYVIAQAMGARSLPTGLKVILGVVQFLWFLFVPIAVGIWWGRGRPGSK
jgi:hypothetical protein